MKFDSKMHLNLPPQLWRRLGLIGLAVGLAVGTGACITATEGPSAPPKASPIAFDHEQHTDQGLTCDICHSPDESQPGRFTLPGHDVCGVCHEIPEDMENMEACQLCHKGEEFNFDRTSLMHPDIKFAHEPHMAAEVECATCHQGDLDEKALPTPPLKPFCMNCHGKEDPKLNECAVCHTEIDREYIPTTRAGARLPHDSPEIWEHIHGRESRVDPMFCAMCHEEQESCQNCHSRVEPADHTLVWRDKTHGLHATWERNRCAACHEEDFCVKCHENTTPDSHRGGWGTPVNRHCVSCHFPEDQTNCTVCHQSIDHRSAMPSPHNFGIFPPNCAKCHPGGLPFRAPHAVNSTVRCVVCHK